MARGSAAPTTLTCIDRGLRRGRLLLIWPQRRGVQSIRINIAACFLLFTSSAASSAELIFYTQGHLSIVAAETAVVCACTLAQHSTGGQVLASSSADLASLHMTDAYRQRSGKSYPPSPNSSSCPLRNLDLSSTFLSTFPSYRVLSETLSRELSPSLRQPWHLSRRPSATCWPTLRAN